MAGALLVGGADVNARADGGWTPLHLAGAGGEFAGIGGRGREEWKIIYIFQRVTDGKIFGFFLRGENKSGTLCSAWHCDANWCWVPEFRQRRRLHNVQLY